MWRRRKVLGINSTIKPQEYTSLQLKFKTAHGKRTPAEIPGASIIEQLDREIEEGEFTPVRMEEFPSKEEVTAANKDKIDNLGIPMAMTASGHYVKQQVRGLR